MTRSETQRQRPIYQHHPAVYVSQVRWSLACAQRRVGTQLPLQDACLGTSAYSDLVLI